MVIMMTLKDLRKQLKTLFTEHQIESPEADSGLLLMHVLGISKTQLLLSNQPITEAELKKIYALAERRIQGEPLRYLTGICPFMDLEFYVNPSTLIPRPDTELLVDTVSQKIEQTTAPLTLWDIGCGSGCIGITLAHRHDNLQIVELDISQEALDTAKRTALRYGVADRITFLKHDILSGMPNLPAPDIVVSNPPYIPTADITSLQKEVRLFEPTAALDGGNDGLDFYRFMIAHLPLKAGGLLAFEIGYDQGISVPALMHDADYHDVTLLYDLGKNPRVVLGYH